MVDKNFLIETLRHEAADFAETMAQVQGTPIPQVPSTPEWNATDLLLHLGSIQRRIAQMLQTGQSPNRDDTSFLNLSPEFLGWYTGKAPSDQPVPAVLIEWFREGAEKVANGLEKLEPGQQDGQNRGPFSNPWLFMAQETALHRWDAQGAIGAQQPIEAEFALAAINYYFDMIVPLRRRYSKAEPLDSTLTYHFHRTDGEGEWLLKLAPEGATVEHTHAKGDVAVRGSASDLLLFLYHRLPASQLATFGEPALLERYFELVPPV